MSITGTDEPQGTPALWGRAQDEWQVVKFEDGFTAATESNAIRRRKCDRCERQS